MESVADLSPPGDRGPVIGPVGGGFLANARGWRWVFWLVAIAGGAVTVAMMLVCRETYAPLLLLRRKLQRLRRETGNPRLRAVSRTPMVSVHHRFSAWASHGRFAQIPSLLLPTESPLLGEEKKNTDPSGN